MNWRRPTEINNNGKVSCRVPFLFRSCHEFKSLWSHDATLSIFLFIIFCCNVLIFSWYLYVLPSLSTGLSVYCILWLWILPTTILIKWYWYWPLGVHVIAGEGESENYLAINYNVSSYPPQALIPLKKSETSISSLCYN